MAFHDLRKTRSPSGVAVPFPALQCWPSSTFLSSPSGKSIHSQGFGYHLSIDGCELCKRRVQPVSFTTTSQPHLSQVLKIFVD